MNIFRTEGERRFDECPLKTVVYKDRVYTDATRSTTNDADEYKDKDNKEITYGGAGTLPQMTCPKTKDMNNEPIYTDKEMAFDGYKSKNKGLRNLRMIAGATACASCEYAGRTPIEVAQMREEYAAAEARALIAQANVEHLRKKLENGESIIEDLPPNGGVYLPAIEQ